MRVALICLLTGFCLGAAAQKNRLDVHPVTPGYWVHTSYNEYRGATLLQHTLHLLETAPK